MENPDTGRRGRGLGLRRGQEMVVTGICTSDMQNMSGASLSESAEVCIKSEVQSSYYLSGFELKDHA